MLRPLSLHSQYTWVLDQYHSTVIVAIKVIHSAHPDIPGRVPRTITLNSLSPSFTHATFCIFIISTSSFKIKATAQSSIPENIKYAVMMESSYGNLFVR